MSTNNTQEFLVILGELVKKHRAVLYDQADFALRVGCSKKTISRMEQGQPVNAETLFVALDLLGLLDDYLLLAESQRRVAARNPSRHRMSYSEEDEFPNDF